MPKTLLLADDSVTIQKVVGLSFASEDVILVTVNNGDDALTRARELRPDLVLADVVMPGKNGYDVCEAIKSDPALRHIPVLLLTGTFEAFDQERARRAGADGHVTKPFEAQALVQQAKDLMERAQQALQAPPAPAPAFDVPTLSPLTGNLPPMPPDPTAAPAEDPFFEDELAHATSFGEEVFDLDADAAAGELELATVAEEDSDEIDALGEPELATPDAPTPQAPIARSFDVSEESFRGSPVLTPEMTDGDLLSPRAVAPAPAIVLPDDDFDLGFDEPPFSSNPAAVTATPSAPLPPARQFGEDDPASDTVLDPGRAKGYDLSFGDLDDPLSAARGELANEPELAPMARAAAVTAPLRDDTAPAGAAPASGPGLTVDLSPVLRQRLHDTLEKVAWEAFADLSDTIVRQALERIETIAWEVIPQMAEQLIREEIRRMKGDSEDA